MFIGSRAFLSTSSPDSKAKAAAGATKTDTEGESVLDYLPIITVARQIQKVARVLGRYYDVPGADLTKARSALDLHVFCSFLGFWRSCSFKWACTVV